MTPDQAALLGANMQAVKNRAGKRAVCFMTLV